MPPRYEMPYRSSERKTFERRTNPPARNRQGQWHELVQHLHDLHYISEAFFVAWHKRRAADKPPLHPQLEHIYAGISIYLGEDDYSLYKELAPFPAKTFTDRTEWVEKHLSILVFRLSQFTSFDDEMDPPNNYRVGEQTVYGRSLFFRIRVLFAFGHEDFSGKTYFDASLLGYLAALNNGLGDPVRNFRPTAKMTKLPDKFWRYLLSWDQLFAAFRKQHRFIANDAGNRMPYILVYDLEAAVADGPIVLSQQEERRRKRLQRKLARRLRNARLHEESGDNQLGIRLLQLGLWRSGFYVGAIDGAFGPMSHSALRDMLGQEWEADRPVVSQRQLGLALQSGDDNEGRVWVADLRSVGNILEAYAPPSGAEADWEENAVWESISKRSVDPDWEEEILNRRDAVKELYPKQQVNPFRRIYFGLRGLLRGAFRAIKKVLRWVIDRVGAVAGAIFSFLKATIKRIQEGIGLFFEGFRYFTHYLLGKPFVTTGAEREDGTATISATRLVLDFDTTNVVSADVTDDDIANHRTTLRSLREGLDFFLKTVGTIFNLIGSLTTPMGWVRLGVLIARVVRTLLRKFNVERLIA